MYVFVNKGLGMSTGKAAAQASHAAVEAFRKSDPALVDAWLLGGHYKKLVMEADDSDELANVGGYLDDRGFAPAWIYDEGLTEFDGRLRHTAIGVPIVDKDDPNVAATFSTFRLYKDKLRIVELDPSARPARSININVPAIRWRGPPPEEEDGVVTTNNIFYTGKPAPAPDGVRVVDVTASARPARQSLAAAIAKLRALG